MQFLKKNYEKILLGLVLAGLVGALVFMPFYISADNQNTTETISSILNPPVKELTNLDLTVESTVAARLHSNYQLDLESTNRTFNPLEWQKGSDGNLVLIATHVGPHMVVVTNITPLCFILTFDGASTNELGARYNVGVERQAEKIAGKRHKVPRFVSVGDKPNDAFTLVSVKGAVENPDELVLKLADSGEVISIAAGRPFRMTNAYSVDFRYDPERKVFRGKRAGDKVSFSGTDFLVDDVKADELILQDQSNQKKTSRPYTP
jgi:hypothetical protein